jgi:hypothetical protein
VARANRQVACRPGIQGTTIHATLARNHGYTGSYSSGYRFLLQLDALQVPEVPLRLECRPAESSIAL